MRKRDQWLLSLLALCVPPGHAAGPGPQWLAALNEIRMLPDPLDARRIGAIPGAPRFKAPRCVQAATIRPGQASCWAETGGPGPVLKATLSYWRAGAGGPATDGSLELVIAAQACTTVGQVEQGVEQKLQARMPPVDVSSTKTGYFSTRLFGHDMAPIMLSVETDADGCIAALALRR